MSAFERCVVLVTDDEPVVLKLVTHALERHGYIVVAAEDGAAALRICQRRQGPIHLALLDVMMPGMNGPELYECLKELHAKIEVLFMSGWSSALISDLVPDMESAHFIAKPFAPRDIVRRVNEILGNEDVCTLLDDEPIAAHA